MENLQQSFGNKKRKQGDIYGCLTLLEETNPEKHRWKVKCNKCNTEFELASSSLTKYYKENVQSCRYCPKEYTPSKYKIGEIFGCLKIIEVISNSKFKVECQNCKNILEISGSYLSQYASQNIQHCRYCKTKVKTEGYKYKAGDILGNCYELQKLISGGNIWIVKCTKCGKLQEQSIPNMKKHKKDTCFYCEHPNSSKPAFGRTRQACMNIDERIYTYYKNSVENRNLDPLNKQKEWNLNFEQYKKLIHSNCFYCGEPPTNDNVWNKSGKRSSDIEEVYINGIDRIDSNKGYSIDNCVPCCPQCNHMKLHYTTEQFFHKIKQIYNYQKMFDGQSNNDVASSECEMGDTLPDNAEGNDMT